MGSSATSARAICYQNLLLELTYINEGGASSRNAYRDPSIGLGLAPVSNKLDRRVVLKEGRTRY